MKLIKNLTYLLGFFAAALLIVSCEADGTGTGNGGSGTGSNDDFPNVKVSGLAEQTVGLKDTVYYDVSATKTKDPLKTITVKENGTNLPLDRVLYDGKSIANPLLLSGNEKESFAKKIGIITSDQVGTNKYTIIVTDDSGRNVTSDEISVTTVGTPPTLSFTSSMSGSVTIKPNSLQNYPLSGVTGSGKLVSIAVYENDALVDASRVEFDGTKANPVTISKSNQDGFTSKNLTLRSNTATGTNQYKAVLTDEFGLTSELAFTITTGTPVTTIMGVLFNQAGPAGTGGLDLDTGDGTGSTDSRADIRDQGIDSNGDWLKKFNTVNGSVIKYVKPGQNGVSENFSFSSVKLSDDIAGLFANGVTYAEEVVKVGDIFTVQRDGKNYLIRVAKINETSGNNDDNYEIDIKK